MGRKGKKKSNVPCQSSRNLNQERLTIERDPELIAPPTFWLLKECLLRSTPESRFVFLSVAEYAIVDVNPKAELPEDFTYTHFMIFCVRILNTPKFQPLGTVYFNKGQDQEEILTQIWRDFLSDLSLLRLFVVGSISNPTTTIHKILAYLTNNTQPIKETGPIEYSSGPYKNILHLFNLEYLISEIPQQIQYKLYYIDPEQGFTMANEDETKGLFKDYLNHIRYDILSHYKYHLKTKDLLEIFGHTLEFRWLLSSASCERSFDGKIFHDFDRFHQCESFETLHCYLDFVSKVTCDNAGFLLEPVMTNYNQNSFKTVQCLPQMHLRTIMDIKIASQRHAASTSAQNKITPLILTARRQTRKRKLSKNNLNNSPSRITTSEVGSTSEKNSNPFTMSFIQNIVKTTPKGKKQVNNETSEPSNSANPGPSLEDCISTSITSNLIPVTLFAREHLSAETLSNSMKTESAGKLQAVEEERSRYNLPHDSLKSSSTQGSYDAESSEAIPNNKSGTSSNSDAGRIYSINEGRKFVLKTHEDKFQFSRQISDSLHDSAGNLLDDLTLRGNLIKQLCTCNLKRSVDDCVGEDCFAHNNLIGLNNCKDKNLDILHELTSSSKKEIIEHLDNVDIPNLKEVTRLFSHSKVSEDNTRFTDESALALILASDTMKGNAFGDNTSENQISCNAHKTFKGESLENLLLSSAEVEDSNKTANDWDSIVGIEEHPSALNSSKSLSEEYNSNNIQNILQGNGLKNIKKMSLVSEQTMEALEALLASAESSLRSYSSVTLHVSNEYSESIEAIKNDNTLSGITDVPEDANTFGNNSFSPPEDISNHTKKVLEALFDKTESYDISGLGQIQSSTTSDQKVSKCFNENPQQLSEVKSNQTNNGLKDFFALTESEHSYAKPNAENHANCNDNDEAKLLIDNDCDKASLVAPVSEAKVTSFSIDTTEEIQEFERTLKSICSTNEPTDTTKEDVAKEQRSPKESLANLVLLAKVTEKVQFFEKTQQATTNISKIRSPELPAGSENINETLQDPKTLDSDASEASLDIAGSIGSNETLNADEAAGFYPDENVNYQNIEIFQHHHEFLAKHCSHFRVPREIRDILCTLKGWVKLAQILYRHNIESIPLNTLQLYDMKCIIDEMKKGEEYIRKECHSKPSAFLDYRLAFDIILNPDCSKRSRYEVNMNGDLKLLMVPGYSFSVIQSDLLANITIKF